jgi:hypothetical protein
MRAGARLDQPPERRVSGALRRSKSSPPPYLGFVSWVALATWFMEHRRDVRGGDLRTCTASGSRRRQESAGGGQRVWPFARYSTEDAAVRSAARLSVTAADQASEAGAVAGRHRRYSERRQAAAHIEADLGAAKRGARLHGRLHDREGLRARGTTPRPGDVCAADACRGRGTGGFWRGAGGDRRCGSEGVLAGDGSAPFR